MKRLLALSAICCPVYLFAQGFGSFSHDQPYLAKDRGASAVQLNDPNVYYWWVATDLSAGSVSTWTDRIHGLQLIAGISAPVKSSNYVAFTSDFISNTITPSVAQDWMIGFILSAPGPWTDIQNLYTRSTDAGSTAYGNGWYFRDSTSFRDGLTLVGTWGNLNNGIIFDFCILKTNSGVSNWETIFTNGVFHSSSDVGAGGYNIGSGAMVGLGSQANQAIRPWLDGKLYELLIWTNALSIGGNASLTASNLHYYGTNTYGVYYIPP